MTATTFVMTESAVHRSPLQVGEFHAKIEVQKPAHCVKYAYSAAHLMKCEPTMMPRALTTVFIS
jgi:hypothetical protein